MLYISPTSIALLLLKEATGSSSEQLQFDAGEKITIRKFALNLAHISCFWLHSFLFRAYGTPTTFMQLCKWALWAVCLEEVATGSWKFWLMLKAIAHFTPFARCLPIQATSENRNGRTQQPPFIDCFRTIRGHCLMTCSGSSTTSGNIVLPNAIRMVFVNNCLLRHETHSECSRCQSSNSTCQPVFNEAQCSQKPQALHNNNKKNKKNKISLYIYIYTYHQLTHTFRSIEGITIWIGASLEPS